jgi:glycosyltransferase involved in cell wall biosynthesis
MSGPAQPRSPRVSLCVPTFGRARHLRLTVESVLAQTYSDFELIVVDDASPDNTSAVMASFADPRVRYVRNEATRGVPGNYNYSFTLARGEYLALVEDHDLLAPSYLEKVTRILDCHPSVGLVATGLDTIDEHGTRIARYVHPLPDVVPGKKMLRRLLLRTTCPFSITAMIRRSALEQLPLPSEPFSPEAWWYADIHLWMNLLARSDFGYLGEPLLLFRTREADHFLTGREWETFLCLDRIHRTNWQLLQPRSWLGDRLDRVTYDAAKIWNIVRFRANKTFYRGGEWTADDCRHVRKLLSPLGRALVSCVGLVPQRTGRSLCRWYLERFRRKHAVNTASAVAVP